ncbi:hypothetical protein BCR32DRAFT_282494 [Anaeromyces robustus]|uniref:Uncharacterized protein n=1 Tax=Anaeromyces robustus TaxID=1754192 RepID=A0A1Y1WXE7_9FUNG|nr:hypothetical protein BCR32DRAFT_282494 [Anaeromyces robustus]|eukprot:ORX78220.1 hypothetical protein BCR32DRAFT_282494 [Anaeromyces robustus]
MTKLESFPIHRLIFQNDPITLKKLLQNKKFQEYINQRDNHGNTPIHLALMLNRHNCLMVLLKYNCNVFTHNYYGWSPLNEASMLGNVDAIEIIILKKWKKIHDILIEPKGLVYEWNKTTPYLYLKLKMNLKSSIPLLKKLNNKCYFTVYKNKKDFLFKTTIGGIDNSGIPKIIDGSISILIKYEEFTNSYTFYGIDNLKKRYQEFYPNVPDFYLINTIQEKLGINNIINFHIDLSHFKVKLKKGKILKKKYKKITLENGTSYKAIIYKARNIDVIATSRKDEAFINENESIIKNTFKKNIISRAKSKRLNKSNTITDDNNDNDSKSYKSTKTSEDDSDSNSDNDSDFNSDNEESFSNKYKENKEERTLNKEEEKFVNYLNTRFNPKGGKDKISEDEVIMYTINKDGESKTFKYESSMESTLDWEQAYHEKYSKNVDLMYDVLGYGIKNVKKVKHLSPQEIEKLNLQKITEEEYFNSTSTNPLHIGRIMEVSEERKHFNQKIKFWMIKENSNFPISAKDIKPVLEYFIAFLLDLYEMNESDKNFYESSPINKLDKGTHEFIINSLIDLAISKNSYPVKISIPIYPSVNLSLSTVDCSTDPKFIPDKLFEIPDNYKNDRVYFERRS